MKNITLIGDSIRMGYQETVATELGDFGILTNPDENGGTSAKVLEHLDEWVISLDPDIVHINAGLHDLARLEENKGQMRLTEEEYEINVRTILNRILDETSAKVIWAQTTPVIDKRHSKNKSFDRHDSDVIRHNEIAQKICQELNVPVNDLYHFVMANDHEKLLTQDGVHYTDEGKELLGREVARVLKSL